MKNEHNLPDWVYTAIKTISERYDPGERTDYSATSLLKPPLLYALEKENDIEVDVADLIASFDGTSLHNSIESALEDDPRYIVEKRFYHTFKIPDAPGRKKNFVVSAQIDLFDTRDNSIWDAKRSQIYKFTNTDMWEYECQLNIQKYLMEKNGHEVDSLNIGGFPKDHKASEARRNPDYPQVGFMPISIPIWHHEDVETFIKNAIIEKENALRGHRRICTPEERWTKPSKWAVMRKGRKSAIRVLDTEEEAKDYLSSLTKADGKEYIEHRPGEDTRCMFYCPVADKCSFGSKYFGGDE